MSNFRIFALAWCVAVCVQEVADAFGVGAPSTTLHITVLGVIMSATWGFAAVAVFGDLAARPSSAAHHKEP